jgi:hypothetical protein
MMQRRTSFFANPGKSTVNEPRGLRICPNEGTIKAEMRHAQLRRVASSWNKEAALHRVYPV